MQNGTACLEVLVAPRLAEEMATPCLEVLVAPRLAEEKMAPCLEELATPCLEVLVAPRLEELVAPCPEEVEMPRLTGYLSVALVWCWWQRGRQRSRPAPQGEARVGSKGTLSPGRCRRQRRPGLKRWH